MIGEMLLPGKVRVVLEARWGPFCICDWEIDWRVAPPPFSPRSLVPAACMGAWAGLVAGLVGGPSVCFPPTVLLLVRLSHTWVALRCPNTFLW